MSFARSQRGRSETRWSCSAPVARSTTSMRASSRRAGGCCAISSSGQVVVEVVEAQAFVPRIGGGSSGRPGDLGAAETRGHRDAEVLVREPRRFASARGAADEAFLHEERLVDVLERRRVLAEDDGERREADRAAVVAVHEDVEQAAVHLVEAAFVHLEQVKRLARDAQVDVAVGLDEREVAHAAQQAVRDARGAARAARDLERRVVVDRVRGDAGRTLHDVREVLGAVEVHAQRDAEARAHGRRQQPERVVAPTSVNGSRLSLSERGARPRSAGCRA